MNLTDSEIKTAIRQYEKRKSYFNERYKTYKDTPEFKEGNCRRATNWYKNGGSEIKKGYYLKNQERAKLVSHLRYYKNKGMMSQYKEKFPDRYQRIMEINPNLLTKDPSPSSQQL